MTTARRDRRLVALLALAACLPLLPWPVAPLTDLPGHIGRYRILAEAGEGPLARHFAVGWAVIGNLGVDLAVLALRPLLDVEAAARLVVTLIPALFVAALLWAGREAHGRVPPAAGFAVPIAYAYPFQLGFVNFWLATALAFAGLALWLRLARVADVRWRLALFAPVACLVWFAHSFGWALLGLFVWGAEWARARERLGPVRAAVHAAALCLPLALPLALMLGAAEPMRGDTGDWLGPAKKARWLAALLCERWRWWDVAGAVAIYCLLWAALRSKRLGFAPVLGVPAALGLVAFLLLPRLFQGGAYVDMRVLAPSVALALVAIRGDPDAELRVWRLGLGFAGLRLAGTALAFLFYAQGQQAALRAISALDPGGAVLVLVDEPESDRWAHRRWTHLAGLATARRRVFHNAHWAVPGQHAIRPLHPRAAPFDRDPSHLVRPPGGVDETIGFDRALAAFDRCSFGQVWTLGFPPGRARARDLRLQWSDEMSAVYRVDPRACLSAARPNG